MSSVDSRIVQMKFDNGQFRKGVNQTLGDLTKLDTLMKGLKLAKGFVGLAAAAKGFDLSGASNQVSGLQSKISALQVFGVTAFARLSNAAINMGTRLAKAVTVQPIIDGFHEYETQIGSIQTIMANTGAKLGPVNSTLNDLNHYADKTIYNFTEMTQNIGRFTAAGVGLKQSADAIKGIANLAALSGSTSQQASMAMYQLSQAIAAGKVNLQDWNSVVNAGMGGKVFQQALIRTGDIMGKNASKAVKAAGSFRESISTNGGTGWLDGKVLTETLRQFTLAEDAAKDYEGTLKKLMDEGYSKKQAESIIKTAKTAEDAATKVKTFSQLIDTLKEALGSGWSKSWQYLIGDFNEAKSLFTSISDVLSKAINDSANKRNKVLKSFAKKKVDVSDILGDSGKEYGKMTGREMMFKGLANSFKALMSVINPIRKAFRDIFPSTTANQLRQISASFMQFTSHLKVSGATAKAIKGTFTGLFSVIKVGVDLAKGAIKIVTSIIRALSPIGKIIVTIAGGIGTLISSLTGATNKTSAISKATTSMSNAILKTGHVLSSFANSAVPAIQNAFKGVAKVFTGVGNAIAKVISGITTGLSKLGKSKSKLLDLGDIKNIFDIINMGISGVVLLQINGFFKSLKGTVNNAKGISGSFKAIFQNIADAVTLFQTKVKVGMFKQIAVSLAILAGAMLILSSINVGGLTKSVAAIGAIMAEITLMLKAFALIGESSKLKGLFAIRQLSGAMLTIATSVAILGIAMKTLGSMGWEQIAKGLVSVAGLCGALVGVVEILSRVSKKANFTRLTASMLGFAISLGILASAMKSLGSMSWQGIAKGLTSIAGTILILGAAMKTDAFSGMGIKMGASFIMLAAGLKILSGAIKELSSMNPRGAVVALGSLGGALLELWSFFTLLEKTPVLKTSAGLLVAAAGIHVLAGALDVLSGISIKGAVTGVSTLGASLGILAIGLRSMEGTAIAAASLVVAAKGILVLSAALAALSGIGIKGILVSLVGLGGALGIIAGAAAGLSGLVPAMLGLGAACALVGAGLLMAGTGLTALAAGIGALASVGSGVIGGFIDNLKALVKGIVSTAASIGKGIANGVTGFIKGLSQTASILGPALVKIGKMAIKALEELIPDLINVVMKLIENVLQAIQNNIGKITTAVIKIVQNLITAIADNAGRIKDIGTKLVQLIADGISGSAGLILDAITQVITSIINDIGSAIQTIGDAFRGLFTTIVGEIQQNIQLIASSISSIITNIGSGISQIVGSIANALSMIGDSIRGLFTTIVGEIVQNIQLISSAISIIGQTIAFAIQTVISTIVNIIVSSITSITDAVGQIGTAIQGLVTTIGDQISGIITAFTDAGTQIAEALITGIGEGVLKVGSLGAKYMTAFLTGIRDNIGPLAQVAAEAIIAFINAIGKWVPKVADAGIKMVIKLINGMADAIDNNVDALIAAVGRLCKAILKALLKGIQALVAQIPIIGRPLASAIGKMIDGLGNKANPRKARASGSSWSSGFVHGIGSHIGSAASKAAQLAISAVRGLGNHAGEFMSRASQAASGFVRGISKFAGSAGSAARSLASRAKAGIHTVGSWVSSGANAARGFVNGIRSKIGNAVSAATSLASAAVSALKRNLKEHSPSRVTAQIGSYAGEGFANGIRSWRRGAGKQSALLGETAIRAIKSPLHQLEALMSYDIDLDPTITPVMDLSNVRSGARQINGITGNLNDVNITASTANSAIQNRFDSITALDNLAKVVAKNQSGETNNVVNVYAYGSGDDSQTFAEKVASAVQLKLRSM